MANLDAWLSVEFMGEYVDSYDFMRFQMRIQKTAVEGGQFFL
jgi:hypothetical protein